mmetsp:Transcript_550/g.1305  ORF Transcript_550/g.1305 Transcript_550/m.1305 type:complete len:404 (-) Transcript_550:60-1271(-)
MVTATCIAIPAQIRNQISNLYYCELSKSTKNECNDIKIQSSIADLNTIPKKPMRPLTAYHIFFQIEREFIIQNIDGEDADKSIHDNKVLLDDVPDRYKVVKLMPDWYAGPGKRQKRKHRKSHGKIGFLELSRVISSRWADLENIDPEVKKFVQNIAARELAEYQEEMKEYKELTKDVTGTGAKTVSPERKTSSLVKARATTRRAAAVAANDAAKKCVASDQDNAPYLVPERHERMKAKISNSYVQVPLHSRFQTAPVESVNPDAAFSSFCTESIPAMGDLTAEIDRFINATDENEINVGARYARSGLDENNENGMVCASQQAEDPSSFLSFLDPLLDYQHSNVHINAEDHYHAQQQNLQESREQSQQQERQYQHIKTKAKNGRMSPSSVVDICDDDIMRLWAS